MDSALVLQGWQDEHPSFFAVGNSPDLPLPRQPLVFNEFQGSVQLSSLLDTGSMQSILSANAYQQIADNYSRQGKTLAQLKGISS